MFYNPVISTENIHAMQHSFMCFQIYSSLNVFFSIFLNVFCRGVGRLCDDTDIMTGHIALRFGVPAPE